MPLVHSNVADDDVKVELGAGETSSARIEVASVAAVSV